MSRSHTFRLAGYVAGVLCIAGLLEGACRHWGALFQASGHRSLFKAALLARRPPQDIVFFGTSRSGEALRPNPFLSELGATNLKAFNVSSPYSSLDILQEVVTHVVDTNGMKLALIEVTEPQLARRPLPWANETSPDADFDNRAGSWVREHSALVAHRKVFVLNSLSRLMLVVFFGQLFDGTEEFGTDYLAALVGPSHDFAPDRFHATPCVPRPLDPAPSTLGTYGAERDIYASLAKSLEQRGVNVAFVVPPSRDPEHSPENAAAQRELRASLHAVTGRPVWDFADCHLPADYFRDPTHLSHLGGSHFSHFVARAAMDDAEIAGALGLAGKPRETNALP